MAKRKALPTRIKRDRRVCEICGLEEALIIEAHHIKSVVEGGDDSECNVTRLCPNCHSLVHEGVYTNLQRFFTSTGRWTLFFDGGAEHRRFPG